MKKYFLTKCLAGGFALACTLAVHAQGASMGFMGTGLTSAAGQRTIAINADTRWVNVVQGEEVRFVVGTGSFSWKFDGPGARSVDLQQVAPPGLLTRSVTAYVTSTGGHPAR